MFAAAPATHGEPAERDHLDKDVFMRQAVGKLDRIDREVLLLREFEQLSYAEIATLLHMPINTVRSRLFRARMELRNLLSAPALVSAAPELTRSEGRA
jgi:RNA polymerase sigma-70 factor (ECF subfamily)